jgi:diguanylate cyclase (GGDEF)-like protein
MAVSRTRAECLDQANRSLLRSAPVGPPAACVLAAILGNAVPWHERVIFVALVTAVNVYGFVTAVCYLRRRKTGWTPVRWWHAQAYAFMLGVAWASFAIMGLPGSTHVELRTVIALFIVGVSASNIVSAAGERSMFWAHQVPLIGIEAVVYLANHERVTRLLGVAMPIYGLVMVALYLEVNRTVVSEIELKHRNADLVEDLTAQQARTDEANHRLRDANEALTALAMRDHLTGLASRAAFLDRLEVSVAGAHRDQSVVGVIYFDIDRFKVVNDSLGHAAGDDLLVGIAQRAAGVLRPTDVLGRLGGDEFVVLLDRLGDSYEAVLVAHRIRDALRAPFELRGRTVPVTVSMGVATTLHRRDGATDLLRHADDAQYSAKQGGRDRVEVFDIELRARVQRRLDMERELREALREGRIVPWYQPQVDLRTGAIVGAEALARWVHPDRGPIGAQEFMAFAEETGAIVEIDEHVMAQSIRARVALHSAGVDRSFRMWCNISPRQLTRGQPVQRLVAYLAAVGCEPGMIGVEITETGVLVDMDAAARELAAARRLGVRVALDDFGTGHSSLTLLRQLPIDEVKIDRSFVRDLEHDPADAAIVAAVTDLAHQLGLEVIAEGIEEVAQEAALQALRCERAQGFRYGRPVPFDELVDQLGLRLALGAA